MAIYHLNLHGSIAPTGIVATAVASSGPHGFTIDQPTTWTDTGREIAGTVLRVEIVKACCEQLERAAHWSIDQLHWPW